MEISQLICFANQLTGFYINGTLPRKRVSNLSWKVLYFFMTTFSGVSRAPVASKMLPVTVTYYLKLLPITIKCSILYVPGFLYLPLVSQLVFQKLFHLKFYWKKWEETVAVYNRWACVSLWSNQILVHWNRLLSDVCYEIND